MESAVWHNALGMLHTRGYKKERIKSMFLHMYKAAIVDDGDRDGDGDGDGDSDGDGDGDDDRDGDGDRDRDRDRDRGSDGNENENEKEKEKHQKQCTEAVLPKLMVIMDTNEKVGIETVRRVIHELMSDIQVAILIIRKKITPFAQQAIDQLHHGNNGRIEVFTFSDLYVNIRQHKFVPQHQVLSKEEKEVVTKSFSANDAVFPKLLKSDPIARYYGLTQGDMIKFIRKTGYETRNIYRVVM